MRWNNGDNKLTMDLTTDTNVANIMMAPGFANYSSFETRIGQLDDEDPIICEESIQPVSQP